MNQTHGLVDPVVLQEIQDETALFVLVYDDPQDDPSPGLLFPYVNPWRTVDWEEGTYTPPTPRHYMGSGTNLGPFAQAVAACCDLADSPPDSPAVVSRERRDSLMAMGLATGLFTTDDGIETALQPARHFFWDETAYQVYNGERVQGCFVERRARGGWAPKEREILYLFTATSRATPTAAPEGVDVIRKLLLEAYQPHADPAKAASAPERTAMEVRRFVATGERGTGIGPKTYAAMIAFTCPGFKHIGEGMTPGPEDAGLAEWVEATRPIHGPTQPPPLVQTPEWAKKSGTCDARVRGFTGCGLDWVTPGWTLIDVPPFPTIEDRSFPLFEVPMTPLGLGAARSEFPEITPADLVSPVLLPPAGMGVALGTRGHRIESLAWLESLCATDVGIGVFRMGASVTSHESLRWDKTPGMEKIEGRHWQRRVAGGAVRLLVPLPDCPRHRIPQIAMVNAALVTARLVAPLDGWTIVGFFDPRASPPALGTSRGLGYLLAHGTELGHPGAPPLNVGWFTALPPVTPGKSQPTFFPHMTSEDPDVRAVLRLLGSARNGFRDNPTALRKAGARAEPAVYNGATRAYQTLVAEARPAGVPIEMKSASIHSTVVYREGLGPEFAPSVGAHAWSAGPRPAHTSSTAECALSALATAAPPTPEELSKARRKGPPTQAAPDSELVFLDTCWMGDHTPDDLEGRTPVICFQVISEVYGLTLAAHKAELHPRLREWLLLIRDGRNAACPGIIVLVPSGDSWLVRGSWVPGIREGIPIATGDKDDKVLEAIRACRADAAHHGGRVPVLTQDVGLEAKAEFTDRPSLPRAKVRDLTPGTLWRAGTREEKEVWEFPIRVPPPKPP